MSTLETWAQRRPATRWPLVLLCLLLLFGLAGGLTGCGGGGGTDSEPVPTVLATDTSTAQAGDANIGAAVLVLPLPGPVIELAGPAHVRVVLTGRLLQTAHYPATAHATLALQLPAPTSPSTVAGAVGDSHDATELPLDYTALLTLPAGRTVLQAGLQVRAIGANGLPTAALARADVVLDWRVELLR